MCRMKFCRSRHVKKCDQSISEHFEDNRALIVHVFVAEDIFCGLKETCQMLLKYLEYLKSYGQKHGPKNSGV